MCELVVELSPPGPSILPRHQDAICMTSIHPHGSQQSAVHETLTPCVHAGRSPGKTSP
jgi:hypothetical protein